MIHQFKQEEFNIVVDTYSGGVHVVDDLVYDMIAAIDAVGYKAASEDHFACLDALKAAHGEAAVAEALEEIQELVEEEVLFTEDPYKPILSSLNARKTVVKALCLHIAHDCNLKCQYCFAEEGEYHGHRELMSYEVGKKAMDFLVRNSGTRRNLEVDFFGGEPLMNFDVVKQLVTYGRSLEEPFNKHFRFTLTTNGVLLNEEVMQYLNENMDNVVLSIDGRKEVHDKMRPTANGKGSYDLILPKFKRMAELREQMRYYVRGTFTACNLDFSEDVLHLADEGFEQISMEPVVTDPKDYYALKEEHLPKIYEEYEKLAHAMRIRRAEGRPFNFFHFMMDLGQGPCIVKRVSGCGSGCEYLAVHPNGDLYPCHQFVGQPEYIMGTVDTGVVRQDIYEKFKAVNVYSKPGCQDCWAKFYCSGGCAANAQQYGGDMHNNYELSCKMERKRLECAIMLKAAEAAEADEEEASDEQEA